VHGIPGFEIDGERVVSRRRLTKADADRLLAGLAEVLPSLSR
jgi:hypothetical protein